MVYFYEKLNVFYCDISIGYIYSELAYIVRYTPDLFGRFILDAKIFTTHS